MGHVHPEDSLGVFLWGLPCPHVDPAFFESSVLQLFPVPWLFTYWFVSPARLNSWAHELVSVFVALASRIGLACSKKELLWWCFVSLNKPECSKSNRTCWEERFCFVLLVAERVDLYCCCRAVSSFLFQICCNLFPGTTTTTTHEQEAEENKANNQTLPYFGISIVYCTFRVKMIEPWLSRPELIHTLALVRFFSQSSCPVFTLKKKKIGNSGPLLWLDS